MLLNKDLFPMWAGDNKQKTDKHKVINNDIKYFGDIQESCNLLSEKS